MTNNYAEFGFIPAPAAAKSSANYSEFGFVPASAPSTQEEKKPASFGMAADLLRNVALSELANPSNLKSAGAAILQGGTDFVNSLSGLAGNGPLIETNFFDKFGVNPNLLTQAATGAIATAPYALAPELLAPRIGLAAAGLLPLAGRTALRGAAGVAENEGMERGKGNDPTLMGDALSALMYGGTGILGDVLPMHAASVVKNMQKNKLPNEAIIEGNRAVEFPDVGNIVGNPKGAAQWDNLTKSWFSPAKTTQEAHITQAQGVKYANLQDADTQAMQLYKDLAGKPRVAAGEKIPTTIQEAISNDLNRAYQAKSAEGTGYFKELEPEFNTLDIQALPGAKKTAEQILKEAEQNATFGVTDAELKNDIIARANNAFKGQPTPERLALKKSLADNEHFYKQTGSEPALKEIERIKAELATPAYPVSQAIKEERNLSSISGDLKARGDNNAARYYDMLANAYTKDINSFLQTKNPDLLARLGEARNFWKNNVIPFRESPTIRSLITNNKDETEAALNLASTLTNGQNAQLLSILPKEVQDRIAAGVLFKNGFNAVGDTSHLAADLSRAVNNIEPARLSDILGTETKSKLRNISKSVDQNAKVLNDLDKATKTVGGEGGGAVADVSSHGVPGLFARIGNSALNSTTAPFWSRFLNAEQSPEVLKRVMNNTPTNLEDIRAIKAQAPLKEKILPRGILSEILSKPNLTRIPLAGTAEGAKERKESKKNGSR